MRILIVEDEERVARALERGLEADQFSASIAQTGEEGFFLASAEAYDMVILDLMLPSRDCLEILTALRGETFARCGVSYLRRRIVPHGKWFGGPLMTTYIHRGGVGWLCPKAIDSWAEAKHGERKGKLPVLFG